MNTEPSTTAPEESFGVLLWLVKHELVRALERDLAADGVGLRHTQFLVIKRLATLGPMSASELARSLEHDCGAMTRILDQLEHKGYLRRHKHAQDRRALRIELTDAGEAMWRHLDTINQNLIDRAQRDLDPSERKRLLDYLGRVLGALRSDNTPHSA
ncbi:MarR family transcriptional regulator [Oleiagrimonas sp. C23AA]|uniref:MarR family winged helix-turn-helix transcriptional regulator n=1 Tax=Oleiagrimonas sp. C23AA TaxID=2719047 RepID=UPI00141E3098|nr:MarR family transcriptional regulator [Oleiagrimonas sp. C23AA]NII11321.1 MarR family transcriptional regulator [Oleiagrimonas sp. C23AA]